MVPYGPPKRCFSAHFGLCIPAKFMLEASPAPLFRQSLSSTLAIWLRNTAHRLGALRRPLRLFACRCGRLTRKKSRCKACSCRKVRSLSEERQRAKSLILTMVRGQALRAALLVHLDEKRTYPFHSQMAKVELERLSEKGSLDGSPVL